MSWPPFLPGAQEEFDNILEELQGVGKALARRFVKRTNEVISMVRQFPKSGSPLGRRARRLPLQAFPYDLVYVPIEDDILVVAFAHHKRRPGYWRSRLR